MSADLGLPVPSPSADDRNAPQFRDRRAFVVWAVSLGVASYERLTEAILAEMEQEQAE